MRPRSRPAVLAALLVATGVTGCSAAAPAPQSPTQGVTASRVVVGTPAPISGASAPGLAAVAPATVAYLRYTDAHGGVDGRRIVDDVVDDGGAAGPAAVTTRLLTADRVFALLGPVGAPSVSAVVRAASGSGAPVVFPGAGCTCFGAPAQPDVLGFEPTAGSEGRLLGQFILQHLSGQPVGYLSGPDPAGTEGDQGLLAEVGHTHVLHLLVAPAQATSPTGLALTVRELEQAGDRIVVVDTVPAVTARLLVEAATSGYHPQWLLFSGAGDPTTLLPLLRRDSGGALGGQLLDGILTEAFLPPATDATNAWVRYFRSVLARYDPGAAWDGATEYGLAVGYDFVQALRLAGRPLTRTALLHAVNGGGAALDGPGLVPFSASPTGATGYSGAQLMAVGDRGATETPQGGPETVDPSGDVVPATAPAAPPPPLLGG